jgi:hypothetical protein
MRAAPARRAPDAILSKNSHEAESCGFSLIILEQADESLAGTDRTDFWLFVELRLNDLVLQPWWFLSV